VSRFVYPLSHSSLSIAVPVPSLGWRINEGLLTETEESFVLYSCLLLMRLSRASTRQCLLCRLPGTPWWLGMVPAASLSASLCFVSVCERVPEVHPMHQCMSMCRSVCVSCVRGTDRTATATSDTPRILGYSSVSGSKEKIENSCEQRSFVCAHTARDKDGQTAQT